MHVVIEHNELSAVVLSASLCLENQAKTHYDYRLSYNDG